MDKPRKIDINAKCRAWIDSDGWLNVWDGHATVALAPDESEALRAFLPPADSPRCMEEAGLEDGIFRFRVLEPGRACVKIWSGEFVFNPEEVAELARKFTAVAAQSTPREAVAEPPGIHIPPVMHTKPEDPIQVEGQAEGRGTP